MAQALMENQSLASVRLLDNGLGDHRAAVIAEALRENTALTELTGVQPHRPAGRPGDSGGPQGEHGVDHLGFDRELYRR